MELPNKKYDIIVVDPPWDLKKLKRKKRPKQVNMDYPVMSLEDISALDVGSLAKDDCWLFLWTTQKYLFDAKSILEGWGFNYLVMAVWYAFVWFQMERRIYFNRLQKQTCVMAKKTVNTLSVSSTKYKALTKT